MSFANMRVSTKLYLGFSIPAVFMIIGTIIALYNMGKIQANMEHIVNVNNTRAALCSDMDMQANEGFIATLNILLSRDDTFRQAERKQIEKNITVYLEDFKKVEAMTARGDSRGNGLITRIKNLQNAYRQLNGQVLEMAFAHNESAAVELLNAKAKPAFDVWMNGIDELTTHQQDQSKIRYDESEKTYAAIRQLMVSAVVAGMLVLGFIAFMIIRGITNPLHRVIVGLSDGSGQVSSAAMQVSATSQQLAEGTSEQASSLEETSASLEEMSSMTKQNADNSTQAKAMMAEVREIVEKANAHMENMVTAIGRITTSSEETGKIIKTIDEIAFQTNLLALNAAVEAARAGEAGAGFAVVADEVRSLALRAAEAARNTNDLIENTIKAVHNGNELTRLTQEAFRENAEISGKVEQLVDEIAAASQEQAEGIGQVNRAVLEMDKVTQKTAANAEESAAASEELNAQAEQLKGFVGDLLRVVNGGGNSPAAGAAGYAQTLPRADHQRPALSSRQDASRPSAARRRTPGNVVTPEQVIPLGEGDFKDF